MGADRPPALSAIGLILILALIWGLNWPAMRVAVGEFSPWFFRAVCLVVGPIALFSVAIARKTPLRVVPADYLPLVAVGILNVGAYQLMTAFGLTMVPAGRGVILGFTFPLWSVALGAVILKERITLPRLVALLLGLAGMALLMGPDLTEVGGNPWGGVLLIGSALSWAVATMIVKSHDWSIEPFGLATWQVLIGGAPVVAGALILGTLPDWSAISAYGWAALVYSSLIAVAAGQYLWFRILPVMPSAVASISTLATPVVGVWSAALLLGEPVGWRELAALILVFAGLAIVLVGTEGWRTIKGFLGRAGR